MAKIYTFAFVIAFITFIPQQYNPNNVTGEPEWYQPYQMLKRKTDFMQLEIKELQDRIVAIESALDKDDPLKSALLRRWEAMGDE